ncbi:MAG TPA: sulfate transporter CysZ [Gammaproteobacteria bacterium]|nr:sulfate transporter CysZ [Gammaproteobacteria bacterium]
MTSFTRGAGYFLTGFSLITSPRLRRFVILPLLANIILFIGLFFVFRHYLGELNAWLLTFLPVWLQWLDWLLGIFFFTGFAIFFIYAFATVANLLACPFNGLLSERVVLLLTGTPLPERSFREQFKDLPSVFGRQFSLIFYYGPRAFLILILFFIPVVNVVAPALWFIFNAWFMAMQYLDYPTEAHRISLSACKTWMRDHRALTLGFGLAVLVGLMIPVVNFFAIPAAVAGATALWVAENPAP